MAPAKGPAGSRIALALFLCFAAVLAGCGASQPSLPPLTSDAVILAFGDSLTYGTGARPEQSYPAILEGLVHRQVINGGKPGELSGEGVQRLRGLMEREAPALLILCHGGNDLLRRRSPEQAERNLREMVAVAHEHAVPVVLLGVPEPGLFLSAAEFYGLIAEDLDVPYDGEVLAEILADRRLKSDRVHPNAEGYRVLAQAVAGLLDEAGAI